MTSKSKFILMLILIFCGFIVLQIILFMTHKDVNRSSVSLMNQYYKLRNTDPLAAKRTLEVLIKQNPHDQDALRELAFWYLNQGDIRTSLTQFEIAYQNDKQDKKTALQLSKLYMILNQPNKAKAILANLPGYDSSTPSQVKKLLSELPLNKSTVEEITSAASMQAASALPQPKLGMAATETKITPTQILLNQMQMPSVQAPVTAATQTQTAPVAAAKTVSERDKLMNEFYALKNKKSPLAWGKINQVIAKYPNDVQALKEGGYYALITLKNNQLAEPYFLWVYALTNDPKIALQLGYIYDNLDQKRTAYDYFDLATNTTNMQDRMSAELAKINLRGIQTKMLPAPYYAALDYSPIYMSRFKLLIHPIIFRLGRDMNKRFNWKIYLSYRRTSDDRSSTFKQISNIFEDNAAITAAGTQLTPLPFWPQMIVFAELGKSVDLVYRKRSRWRSDFRGGLAFYNEWGRPPEYTFQPTLMLKPNADIYGDAIYYNRYHDGIATLRFRPGVKILRYGSASIDLYYRAFIVEDQARQFYNNIMELGPGIAVRFSDRYNIVLRHEATHGRYLPANSPSVNPYSKNYHNAITELDTYFEF